MYVFFLVGQMHYLLLLSTSADFRGETHIKAFYIYLKLIYKFVIPLDFIIASIHMMNVIF